MTDPKLSSPREFWRVLFFPLSSRGGAIFLTVCTGLLTAGQSMAPFRRRDPGVYFFIFAAILAASYLYRVADETVSGNPRAPNFKPDDWEDAWLDLGHYLGGLLIAFLPVWFMLVYALLQQKDHLDRREFQVALGVCAVIGTAYLPIALLLNGFAQRFLTAFNFGVGFRAIRTMGADYAFVSLYFLVGHAAWVLLYAFWVQETPRGWNGARVTASALTVLFGLYVSVLQMRALGKTYAKHHDALGWTLGKDA
jgi:hypothetical protein